MEISDIFEKDDSKMEVESNYNEDDVSNNMNFSSARGNRGLNKKYDIKFSIGSDLFVNMLNVIKEINYDAVFMFKKDEIMIFTVDIAKIYNCTINIDKTELSEYEYGNLLDNEDYVAVFVDTSIIEDLHVVKNKPIDVYIDIEESKNMYMICENSFVRRRLNSMNVRDNSVLSIYENIEEIIDKFMKNESYEKAVVSDKKLKSAISFVSKTPRRGEKKEYIIVDILYDTNYIDFKVSDKLKDKSYMIEGEDAIVYPMSKGWVRINTEYLRTFNILNTNSFIDMYLSSEMPLMMQTKLGGGGIKVTYIIAPRTDKDEE